MSTLLGEKSFPIQSKNLGHPSHSNPPTRVKMQKKQRKCKKKQRQKGAQNSEIINISSNLKYCLQNDKLSVCEGK